MKKIILIIFSLVLNSFFVKSNTLICGENQIENCKECSGGEEPNTCKTCEPGHFPLLENLLCFPCDDPTFNQVGCEGECDSKDYSNSGFAYCQNCKKGYYNLEGLCISCEKGSPGCSECTYDKDEEIEIKRFKCTKCLNEIEYRINDTFGCDKCNEFIDYCKKCHFKEGELEPECDECISGYYLDEDKRCSYCTDEYIDGKICLKCSSDDKYDNCWCDQGYVLSDNSCIKCHENCDICEYNKEKNTLKCLVCQSGYTLDSTKECVKCDEGCSYCYLDQSNKPKCLVCESNKFLPDKSKCLICPKGCSECEYDSIKKEPVCVRCDYWISDYLIFDPNSKKCLSCDEIEDTGEGCETCEYNISSKKYECKSCITQDEYWNDEYHEYIYINNTLQCKSNTNPEIKGLFGCEFSLYINPDKYECLKCKTFYDHHFTLITNDKSCIESTSVGLPDECIEAEKKGDSYSCTKCNSDYMLIEDISSNLKNCEEKQSKLPYCLEGKKENEDYYCTRCIDNAFLKNNNCSCNPDSFGMDEAWCFKCNDDKKGNPGCDETQGCDFYPGNSQLNCKKCRDGYYEYTTGQCFSCFYEIPNCGKCHYEKGNDKLICDECINDIYTVNEKGDECELNDCEEYPEISPGCIICKDKLNEYKPNNKCQRCQYGYFKTKDEKCVYCSSEQNGGLGCFNCGYEINANGIETNKIICKECHNGDVTLSSSYDGKVYISYFEFNEYPYTFLSQEGKCYDCKAQISPECNKCILNKDTNGIESLKCISCEKEYYLTLEGNCVSIKNLVPTIPNCRKYEFSSRDIRFEFSLEDDDRGYSNSKDYYNYDFIYETIYTTGLKEFENKCIECKRGLFLNANGNCENLNYDKCSFSSIIDNYNQLFIPCSDFCQNSYYGEFSNVLITIKESYELSINSLYSVNLNMLKNYLGETNKIKACLNNSGEGGEYAPQNLKYCREAYYYPNNNTYQCEYCDYDCIMDEDTHLCYKNDDELCTIGNIGTELMPRYGCIEYFYRKNEFTLVTYENGEKEYIIANGDLTGCVEAKVNSRFINSKYNCTKCSLMYTPYYSKFFDRMICQNIKAKIIKENEIDSELFKEVKESVKAIDGKCEKDYLFTPDGQNCYRCDDQLVGMPGCKGACTFSLKRNKVLKCEGECKTGYIESSEGTCSPCSDISKGCLECHYNDEYPTGYKGIKRQRRIVCDYCEAGYIQSLSGECLDCGDFGLNNCNKCEIDPNNAEKYVCTQCQDDFFMNEKGECQMCDSNQFKGINENKCFDCGNELEGGINNCEYCESDGEKIICQQCLLGYILLTTNNSCLQIAKNKELENFSKCERLTMENNKLVCTRCKYHYSLIKKNNIPECIFARTLYDHDFYSRYRIYYYKKYFSNEMVTYYKDVLDLIYSDYIYNRYDYYYPCQEAENLGSDDNPVYSCNKCYEMYGQFGEEDEPLIPAKITDEKANYSICLFTYELDELTNCTEATYKLKDGKDSFNCIKCYKNNELIFNRFSDTYYCQYSLATFKCVVLYCKTCNPNDGYVCNECLPDYVIDSLTGYCVKKTEVIPAVTWKDIYRLEMNSEKIINNKVIYGPSLRMRGITSSQINTRHAFLIYLIFQIKHRIRNMEEEQIKMPAICEVVEGVDETSDDVNMVEYECIGNKTNDIDLTNYNLDNIEEGNNENSLKKSNLGELVSEIKEELGDLGKLTEVEVSDFTIANLTRIVIFQMNEKIENITANDFKFQFKIEGKLNKDITQATINQEFALSEVDTKASCIFTIGLNKEADLSCDLDVQNHKDIKTFSFKTSQIFTSENKNEIYLSKFNDILLINSEENEENEEKKDDKTIIIIVSVVCGVVGAALIGVGVYFIIRRVKFAKINVNQATIENDNNLQSDTKKNEEESNRDRIIKFTNN